MYIDAMVLFYFATNSLNSRREVQNSRVDGKICANLGGARSNGIQEDLAVALIMMSRSD
jgi:hypothetical protein